MANDVMILDEEKEVVRTQGPATPATLLELAINQGADLDRLERLMTLQTRWEEGEAKKAYVVAMANFKKNPPEILKDKKVKYSSTEYKHATLGQVVEKLSQALGEHGLSANWKTEQKEKDITVTCTITHVLGHSDSTSLTAAADNSGGKNAIQQIASTISYLQRYTLHAITGTAAQDMDDDGVKHDGIFISTDQITEINDKIKEYAVDVPGFLKYMAVDSVESISVTQYKRALASLEAKRAMNAKGKGK